MKVEIGKTSDNKEVYIDFLENPHILVSGSTGSGKSVLLNIIIYGLSAQSSNKLVLIDPKRVEFAKFKDNKNLFLPLCNSIEKGISALKEIQKEIEMRYRLLELWHCVKIDELPKGAMDEIYIIIDELSFFMLADKKKTNELISKIGMIGRACGVHLILATQRPSRTIITGEIQANIDLTIGLHVKSAIESRMIIGSTDCTKLKGKGDAILSNSFEDIHFQVGMIQPETNLKQNQKNNVLHFAA